MPEGRWSVEKLPFSVVRKLTHYLDRQFPEHHNWMSFLENAEIIGVHYTPGEVANFQSLSHRAIGSPSEAIFQDFTTRCLTADDVYIVLKKMGHVAGMKIMSNYVSPHLLQDNVPGSNGFSENGGPMSRLNGDNGLPHLPTNGQFYYHPSHGPVPSSVPQTYMQTTVLRVQSRCTQMGHPAHCTCMSDPYHPLYSQHSPNINGYQNLSHLGHISSLSNSTVSSGFHGQSSRTHTPSHSEYFYGNQMSMPPTQFPSPPPPPYSPQSSIKIPQPHHPTTQDTFTASPHGPRVMHIGDQNNGTSPSDTGCGPLPTLPLSPDDVVSLPNSSLLSQQLPVSVSLSSGCTTTVHTSQYTQSSYSSDTSDQSSCTSGQTSCSTDSSGSSFQCISGEPMNTIGASPCSIYNSDSPGSPLSSMHSSSQSGCSNNEIPSQYHVMTVNGDNNHINGTANGLLGPSTVGNGRSSNGTNCSSPDIMFNILNFKYSELCEATHCFTDCLIGHGAFGSVFKANVRGSGPFAIKKLHNKSEMESEMEGTMFYEPPHQESFMLELQSLVKYKNRNILSLVAISSDGPRPCLIYEYMENGSLADCLQGKRNINLSWRHRLDITAQIADALNFLHTVNHPHCLVHGDVKSSNILLDRYYTPKLSDFGLAKEYHSRPNHRTTVSKTSRIAMGTVAYMAPELLRNAKPSTKTDVYAFGVVMLELYSGKPADDPSRQTRALVYHLQPLFTDPDKNRDLIYHEADDRASWSPETGLGFFDIATFCLVDRPKERSPMDQVRDQIFKLKDEAEALLQLHLQNMTLSQPPTQNPRWN